MNRAIKSVLFLMPVVGILSGLSLSVTTGIFLFLLMLWPARIARSNIAPNCELFLNWAATQLKESFLIVTFLIWCFISCFWSPNLLSSLFSYLCLALPVIITLYLMSMDKKLKLEVITISSTPLLYGLMSAIILFFVEYYTDGFFSTNFRRWVQKKHEVFSLFWLDRGVVFLSILSWIVIAHLIRKEQKKLALGIYISVIYLLYLSDSLAAFVGLIFSGIVYVMLFLTKMRLGMLMRFCFALYIIAMPLLSYKQNPLELANSYSLPDSAKHRLFIWNFVAHKASDHPIIGNSFAVSKIVATENDVVSYGQYEWCLLPLHPHNNVMQIFLETGLIGLLLFLLIVDQILKWTIQNNSPLSAACFINYFVIGMISFSIWQSWWVGVGLFAALIMKAQEEK